jgi:hypothetical protein
MSVATATLPRGHQRVEAMGEVLLGWGALSSLLYVGADVLAAARYEGYSVVSRTIAELSAAGAPTRPLAFALAIAYGVLVIGFGIAVWEAARGRRAVRITGLLLVAYGALALAAPFFPMHARGDPMSLADGAHVALAPVTPLLALLQLAFGSAASGRAFRLYSLATFAVVLAFAALAGAPTAWAGAAERIGAGAHLLWVAILAVVLEQEETRAFAAARETG